MDSADVRAFFERVSGEWDAMRATFYNEKLIDALADRIRANRSIVVADVGTGTAFVAAGLAPAVAAVVGLDSAAGMLSVARRNLDALRLGNVALALGDMERLPLADDSVDAAVANMALHHARAPGAMLAEMARVTRPGGWIAITDEVEHPYEWMRSEQADLWLGFPPSDVEGFFSAARLVEYGYSSLGMQ